MIYSILKMNEEELLTEPVKVRPFCLYDELAKRINMLLMSNRKGDPLCSVCMSFDSICFYGLARCSTIATSTSKKQYFTVRVLTDLDDLLGQRWYIRGLNMAGDFCYVLPGTVKFHSRYCKAKTDYQMMANGTLVECSSFNGTVERSTL